MITRLLACLAAGLLVLLAAGTALAAAQTGDIRGSVTDAEKNAVEGAHVTIAGPELLGTRAAATNVDGTFRFLALPPGLFEVRVEKEGFKTELRRGVRVGLDQTTTIRFTLQLATAEETVEVAADLPVIDTTSAALSETVGTEYFGNLPVGRSYQEVIATLPGIQGRIDYEEGGSSGGNPSVRGEGQYGNNFLLDGFSTRDPATHTFGANVNFDAIEEITVFTDGAPAEYGQATGMIANVVTKRGTDRYHGTVGAIVSTSFSNPAYDWGGDEGAAGARYDILDTERGVERLTPKRRFLNWTLNGTLGGPVVKERLHFFAAFQYDQGWAVGEGAPFVDADSDGVRDEDEDLLKQTSRGHDFLGKLSWSPVPQAELTYTYVNNALARDNDISSVLYLPEAQVDRRQSTSLHNLNGRFFLSDSLVLEAKAMLSRGPLTLLPASGQTIDQSYNDVTTDVYWGNADAADYNQRNREGVAFHLTKYVTRALGEHQVKVGVEYHHTYEARNLIFSGLRTNFTAGPGEDGIYYNDDDPIVGYREYENVGELGHHGYNPVFFAQDSWNPWSWLTVNLGLRVEQTKLLQNEGAEVVNQWMAAPRLNVSVDPTRDGRTQVGLSAGRYYDANSADFAMWADTRSQAVFREWQLDPRTGEFVLIHEQDPASNPAVFDDDLRPYYADRFTLSAKREVLKDLAVGVRGIYSETRDLPEDVILNFDADFMITNPDAKQRKYWGVEVTAEKKLSWGLQLLASYTYSHAKGTTPGNFDLPSGADIGSHGNEVGVFLDQVGNTPQPGDYDRDACLADPDCAWIIDIYDGMGTADVDQETGEIVGYDLQGYYGYLPYHSFHYIKLNASYTMPWQTTVGIVFEFDSGHAWQKRGFVDGYEGYYSYPEGRGSRFMPPVAYFDLHLGQKVPLKETDLEISLDFFNIFGLKAPISYYENWQLGLNERNFAKTMYRQEPRSARLQVHYTF